MVSVKSTLLQTIAAVLATAAIALCTGCSRDETTAVTDNRTAICFSPAVSRHHGHTRSVAQIDESSFNAFDVWAFGSNNTTDDRWDMGIDAQTGFQISRGSTYGVIPEIVDGRTDIWGYTNISQLSYWPFDGSRQMQFYALAPSTSLAGNLEVKGMELNMTRASHSFTYAPPETHNADGTYRHDDQRDIIVAGNNVDLNSLVTVGQTLPRMTVPLMFHPALSQIVFDAQLETNVRNFKVVIKSITLCNIFIKSTCTILSDGTPSWTGLQRGSVTLTPGGTAGVTLETSDGVNFTTSCGGGLLSTTKVPLSNGTAANHTDDNIMVLPQTVIPWATTGSQPMALPDDGTEQAYLKIVCDITLNGHDLIGTDMVYVPLRVQTVEGMASGTTDTAWLAGYKYTYTLTFGLGFDAEGRLNGTPITFAVTASSDWTQHTGDVNL